jgi:hypothetical protein
MLSQILAVVVGLGSVALYLAAFFFPEVHRRHDFFWSGVGLFYALVLWFCAGQVTATEWLGHLASVSLLGWLGWQTLTLRRKRTLVVLQTPYAADSWPIFWQELKALGRDFLRQTPLKRWLPAANPEHSENQQAGFRASSLKDVGYEFLDDVEPNEIAPTRGTTTLQATQQSNRIPKTAQPPSPNLDTKSTGQLRDRAKPAVSTSKLTAWWQKGLIVVTWTGELFSSMTASKPKKPVIEIPPRPPSIKLKPPASSNSDSQIHTNETSSATLAVSDNRFTPPSQTISIVDAQVSPDTDAVTSADELLQPEAQSDVFLTPNSSEIETSQADDSQSDDLNL